MPKLASHQLTEDLFRRLCGLFVDEYADKVILVHSIDINGWPHPAILSYFEVAAKDCLNIRLAMYKTSKTTENIHRTGKVTLSIFDERVTYYIKGTATDVRPEMASAPHNSKTNIHVNEVLVDQADPVLEPGAYIAAGVIYVNPGAAITRPRNTAILRELLE